MEVILISWHAQKPGVSLINLCSPFFLVRAGTAQLTPLGMASRDRSRERIYILQAC